jgi:hypothetical protein
MAALIVAEQVLPEKGERIQPKPELVVGVQSIFSTKQFARECEEWRGEVEKSQGCEIISEKRVFCDCIVDKKSVYNV